MCHHEFVSLIFMPNMIESGTGVTFNDDFVNSTRLWAIIVISSVMALIIALMLTLLTA